MNKVAYVCQTCSNPPGATDDLLIMVKHLMAAHGVNPVEERLSIENVAEFYRDNAYWRTIVFAYPGATYARFEKTPVSDVEDTFP